MFRTDRSPRTVIELKQRQNTLDFPVTWAEPCKGQFSHFILNEPAVFCIIHMAEWMHVPQLASQGLIKQCRGSGPSPSIALLLQPSSWSCYTTVPDRGKKNCKILLLTSTLLLKSTSASRCLLKTAFKENNNDNVQNNRYIYFFNQK